MTRPVNYSPLTTGREAGFTLIELIAVLTLIGILAVVVFPKFASTQAFQQRILSDQLTNLLLQSRLHALSREQHSIALRLVEKDTWLLDVLADSNGDGDYNLGLSQEKLESPNTSISLQHAGYSIDSNEGFLLEFDQLGNIQAVNQQTVTSNILFRLDDKPLCISPAALAWQANSEKECLNG